MVGASWSRAELAAMLRAWDDALDVPPHRGFRLLEHMFRRFTELCGGATDRTVGSMEIKRKYMKNMVDVIAQFNNLHGRNGDGHDVDREDITAEGDGIATPGTVDNTSLVSSAPSQQQARWFEMKRSERKQWFLRLNTKSYKFANIDEETFSSVYKLMQIERVVYGDTIAAGEEEVILVDQARADESVVRHSDASPRDIRVALVRDSAGEWMATQRSSEPISRPPSTPDVPSYPTAATAPAARMPTERTALSLRRKDSAFDRLLASSSGRRGDMVMIDAGSWSDDSDSDSDQSVNSDGDDGDDDGDGTNTYDWGQARHLASLYFQNQGEGEARRDNRLCRQSGSDHMEVREALNAYDVHSDQTGSMMRLQYHRYEPTADPRLLHAVRSLEAQAAELREILDQERDEIQREEQLWQSETMRREQERLEFNELVAQMSSFQDGDAKLQQLRDEVLAFIRSEEEERRKEDEAEKGEHAEHNWFLDEIKRDDEYRMAFDDVHKREQAESEALVELLKQERADRHRRAAERTEILNQIKLLRAKYRKPSEAVGEGIPNYSEATPNTATPVTNSEPQLQDAESGRPVRRSSALQIQRGAIVSPLRTRSGKVKARTTLR